MKQICTQIALLCLLVIGQNLKAQTNSLTISKTNPTPTPGFGTPDSVKASNGFTSTNSGTFEDFAPGQTDTIISPQYYYNTPKSAINFVFSTSAASSGGGVTVTPTVLIITSNGDTVSASASATFKGASVNYYFTFNLANSLPANTTFKIAVIMTLTDKAVTASTFAINALRGVAPVNSPIPLPVKMISFNGKKINSGVSLTWNVAEEMNVNSYEVQRSANGIEFSTIGIVLASNSSSYNYIDGKTLETAFYIIKSVDNDGKYSYSTVVSMKGQQSSIVMKAFPMPVQNQLTVQHNAAANNSRIELVSLDGRLVKSVVIPVGAQQSSIDMSSAKAGVYVIRFVNNAGVETLKVVKQ